MPDDELIRLKMDVYDQFGVRMKKDVPLQCLSTHHLTWKALIIPSATREATFAIIKLDGSRIVHAHRNYLTGDYDGKYLTWMIARA